MENLAQTSLATRRWGARPFLFRPGTSDEPVIQQVFARHDYDLSRLARAGDITACYERIVAAGQVPLIIDAGANIGASALYFADRWPAAHIVAVEADSANNALLERNTTGLDTIDCVHAAIAACSGEWLVVDPGEGNWGFRAMPAQDVPPAGIVRESIAALGMSDLLEMYPSPFVPFICKIDIEGGEADLFAQTTEWIAQFPLLIIELHDWLLPGQGNAANFLRCIAGLSRDFVYRGENVFSICNQMAIAAAAQATLPQAIAGESAQAA
jgi:FkbM family methyltransferase